MKGMSLPHVLQFAEFLNAFSRIERVIYKPDSSVRENDTEHSYHLAMLAWYIAGDTSLSLNKDLVLKYALVHDLVEVYAGDTYIYSKNKQDHESKHDREEAARIRILGEFPFFPDLHDMIDSYEKKQDKESMFVYVLDKIHPVIQIYLDNGKMWREQGITLSMLLNNKRSKIDMYPELSLIWNELEKILIDKESGLFSTGKEG